MITIVYILLSSVLFNHLGLANKLTFWTDKNVIINCSKCLTFWAVLIYSMIIGTTFFKCLGLAFACSYLALWVELGFGYLEKKYNEIWENIDHQKESDLKR